jgi:hypothetical protein
MPWQMRMDELQFGLAMTLTVKKIFPWHKTMEVSVDEDPTFWM